MPRIAFILLAHQQPDQVAELASCLVTAATDAQVWVHWDRNASEEVPVTLVELSESDDRVHLVIDRVRCEWGKFGLVQAPINALREIRAADFHPDVAILLSGSCLPCRPLAELERFLSERPGQDFIEDHDDSWMIDGWRAERWQYRHWFQHQKHPRLEHWSYKLQRLVGIKRRFPRRFEPRFGSQWWALSWPTAEATLDDIAADPKSFHFFKTVWIPDETVFQTYAHKLGRPAGFNLTHFQFTDRGKPVVYYDDHLDYVPTLDFFFARKIAAQAPRLRSRLVALAAEPDSGRDLEQAGAKRDDYEKKIRAQTWYPRPGQLYYRSQALDRPGEILARWQQPYVVLLGPTAMTAKLAEGLQRDPFVVLGEAFKDDVVDLGGVKIPGLHETDAAIRDLDRANYLVRIRERLGTQVPVIRWRFEDGHGFLHVLLRDPHATVVGLVPWTGDPDRSSLLMRAGVSTGQECNEWLPRALFGTAGEDLDWVNARMVVAGWGEPAADAPNAAQTRARVFSESIAGLAPGAETWLEPLVDVVRASLPGIGHVLTAEAGER